MKMILGLCTLLLAGTLFAEPAFRPGEIWPDDHGVHINAHGGGVLFHEGVYYWFGEHKIGGTAGNAAHVGVHVYSSRDLYAWKDEGIALKVSEDPASEIVKGCVLERPKVLFCAKTGKFVMYFHLELKGQGYRAARTGLAVADRPTGPYTFLRSFRPNAGKWPLNAKPSAKSPEVIAAAKRLGELSGAPSEEGKRSEIYPGHVDGGQMSRDMTLFLDDDGKAYHIYASEHNSTMQIAELTDDFLGYTGRYVRILEKTWTEAPAICKWGGWYYLIGSGCTGWDPNTARLFRAKAIFGPWEPLGNPCRGVNPQNGMGPEKTWSGQSTFILPVNGKPGTFIAMFDIWRPKNAIDGRYIWLPVTFDGDSLSITWADAWTLK